MRMNHIHTTLTISFFLFIAFPHSQSSPLPCAQQSYNCSKSVPAILDPFWEESPPSQCNGSAAMLSCYARHEYRNFTVKAIDNATHTMTVVLADTVNDVCSPDFFPSYVNLNKTVLEYYASVHNVTVFFEGCPLEIPKFPSKRNLTCGDAMYYFEEGWEDDLVKEYPLLKDCKERLWLPTAALLNHYDDSDDGAGVLQQALNDGFGVYYGVPRDCRRCNESNGSCSSGGDDEDVVSCQYYCSDQHCSAPKSNKTNGMC